MIRITKDNRTIRTGNDYTEFRKSVYWFQDQRCLKCEKVTSLAAPIEDDLSFHLSHRGTRGMGSAYRDDVLGTNKGQVEGGICGKDHRIKHNQQSQVESKLHWSKIL